MMNRPCAFLCLLLLGAVLDYGDGFASVSNHHLSLSFTRQCRAISSQLGAVASNDDTNNVDDDKEDDHDDDDQAKSRQSSSSSISDASEPLMQTSTVKVDDGGSNLTDRFKYKVNALMGTYDPVEGVEDNEQGTGNILNAMLNFPVRYTFHIVGKTGGIQSVQDEYVADVQRVVIDTAGEQGDLTCRVIPRGTRFTKVQCEIEVLNAGMIATIYKDLDKLERTVMRY